MKITQQQLASLGSQLQRSKAKNKHTDSATRKAETRTKIQLGGLVIKSGLSELLGINPGDDLQLYDEHLRKAAMLLGALMEIVEQLHDKGLRSEEVHEKYRDWEFKGSQYLQYDYLQERVLRK